MNTSEAVEVLGKIFNPEIRVYKSYPKRPPIKFIVINKTDEENDGIAKTNTYTGAFFTRETDGIEDLENLILEKIDTYNDGWNKAIYINTISDTDPEDATIYKISAKTFELVIKETN